MFLLTFFFFLIPIISVSQNNDVLDNKNGFRNFKLGSNPSQIKNIRKNQEHFSKNINIHSYIYTGNDISTIFSVPVSDITLDFFKGKLFSIKISFESFKVPFGINEYKIVLNALEETYGTKWFKPVNESESIINGAIWSGNKVTLEFFMFDFKKDKYDPIAKVPVGGYIHIFDKKLMKEMYASEF